MKTKIKVKNLDCANCAAKLEKALSQVEGVQSAKINFMFQSLTIEAENLDAVKPLIEAETKRKDPGVVLKW